MKKYFLTVLVLAIAGISYAQLNMSLLSHLQYDQSLSDIWGWKDEASGIEYALVGLRNGVSIVSLEDPGNAIEVAFIPGPASTWRDIKTWEDHAYVTNETGDGLLVIDLSLLPDTAHYSYWMPEIPDLGTLNTAHNIYIDEFGTAYLAGTNLNNGGMLFVDVDTDPDNPAYVGKGPNIYAHDVYARDRKMYASELYLGRLGIYNVSDLTAPVLLGSTTTPFTFTHNAWLSDDGNVVFTTDERANAPVAAYDISDPANIVELDQFRPIATLNENVIPHNVHVWEDWLIISYYTDGGIVVDASRPDNLIEVGNFDTFFGASGGFSGTWGAYPFLPSGRVLLSDIGNGLYVLEPNYVRAAWLEGTVTDSITGQVISDVKVVIDVAQANLEYSDLLGEYKTGIATAGTFDVEYLVEGYYPKVVSTVFENGELTLQHVELVPLPQYQISGLTITAADGSPVPNAAIEVSNSISRYLTASDNNGNFNLPLVFEGTYDILVAAWGYRYKVLQNVVIDANESLTITLNAGYQDDFLAGVNNAWSTTATSNAGLWVQAEPTGTYRPGGLASNPEFDLADDFGDQCFVTGNQGGSVGNDDVDDGSVTLFSPYMDLSGYEDPVLTYSLWFANFSGNGQPNDDLRVRVSNGSEEVLIELVTAEQSGGDWLPQSEFHLRELIAITDSMRVIFEASDLPGEGHVVEAGVDGFSVLDAADVVATEETYEPLKVTAYPNPFNESIQIDFLVEGSNVARQLIVYNAIGQKVAKYAVPTGVDGIMIGEQLEKGIYYVQLMAGEAVGPAIKIVKL